MKSILVLVYSACILKGAFLMFAYTYLILLCLHLLKNQISIMKARRNEQDQTYWSQFFASPFHPYFFHLTVYAVYHSFSLYVTACALHHSLPPSTRHQHYSYSPHHAPCISAFITSCTFFLHSAAVVHHVYMYAPLGHYFTSCFLYITPLSTHLPVSIYTKK